MTNGKGEDSPGVAWLLGEDLTALSVLRDMHYPGVYGDPDKMSSANYHVASEHSGGVHIQ